MGTFISEKRHWAQVLVPATVYSILATVYWHLWNWVPTINWIGQKGCLQFIGSLGHYFTPAAPRRQLFAELVPEVVVKKQWRREAERAEREEKPRGWGGCEIILRKLSSPASSRSRRGRGCQQLGFWIGLWSCSCGINAFFQQVPNLTR